MNMPFPSAPTPQAIDWATPTNDVNAWRGTCMHHFSTAEAAITETLLVLDMIRTTRSAVHLVGQKQDALAKAIGEGGAFADKGKAGAKALAVFRSHDALRIQLAHGVARIAIDRSGKWLVILRHLAVRGGLADPQMLLLDQEEASALLKRLQQDSAALCSILGNLRKLVSA